jgi:hypothetical protein
MTGAEHSLSGELGKQPRRETPMTVTHTLQVTGDFAAGRIHGIWLLDVEAVTGSIVSGTTDSDVHMWINTVTGEARLYTGLGSLEGVADVIGTSRRSAAAEIADRNNARYWANETQRPALRPGYSRIPPTDW